MVVALFVRHIKIYKGVKFIPIANRSGFISFVGMNGVGKSSVLEALDNFFNGSEWNINKFAKSEGLVSLKNNNPYIVPVFLIKKTDIKTSNVKFNLFLEKISNHIWSITQAELEKQYTPTASEIIDFINFRSELEKNYSQQEYFLIAMGKMYEKNNECFFGIFDRIKSFRELFLDDGEKKADLTDEKIQSRLKGFNKFISEQYSYVYIPAEVDIKNYTKLETDNMQKLMGKNIQKEIEEAITGATLNSINDSLDKFVKKVTENLQTYVYKNPTGGKNKITMPDLVSKITEAYFVIRILNRQRGNNIFIPINNLSSGEKRKALIDVAEAFIKTDSTNDKKIILAIDEPEASLNVTLCYDQFEKLARIVKSGIQVIVTTHWYGFLPILSDGIAHFISQDKHENITFESYNLTSYRAQIKASKESSRGKFPQDISLKSINDLIQSIVSSLTKEAGYNWLICEGVSEQIYFEYFFIDLITTHNLRILPVGGAPEVKKIYEYLELPLRDYGKDDLSGKVFCLIDTDSPLVTFETKQYNYLCAKRLLNGKTSKTELVNITDKTTTPPTEIEDALDPLIFYKTLLKYTYTDISIAHLVRSNPFNKNAKNSSEALNLRQSDVPTMKKFFDKDNGYNKVDFAKNYVEVLKSESNSTKLDWVEEIRSFLI